MIQLLTHLVICDFIYVCRTADIHVAKCTIASFTFTMLNVNNTIQYNTIQYNTIQYNTIQYITTASTVMVMYKYYIYHK